MRSGVLFVPFQTFDNPDHQVAIEVFEIDRRGSLSRVQLVSVSGVEQKFHQGVEDQLPEWVPTEDITWLDRAPELTPTDPTTTISPDLEKLFYHEHDQPRQVWTGLYRGITFEVVRWEWAHKVADIASSLSQPNWNGYIYVNLEKIPPKYGPSSFWITAKPWDWGKMAYRGAPAKTGDETWDALGENLAKLSKSQVRHDRDTGRKAYTYSDHPILGDIEFHCGITYYERTYSDGDRLIKVGCDWQHICDNDLADGLGHTHPLPVTLNMVIEDLQSAIDSFFKMVPEYGAQAP